MTAITELLSIASPSIQIEPASLAPPNWTGALGTQLGELLGRRNGFYAFESALHVLPSGAVGLEQGYSIEEWNAPGRWRSAYEDLADGCYFFAENVFGGQFALTEAGVVVFDPETGEREVLANDIESWARVVLEDFEYLTGHPLAHAWQAEHGPLPLGCRLMPKVPFMLGGEFETSNLAAVDAVEVMRTGGALALQTRGLADGSTVALVVSE